MPEATHRKSSLLQFALIFAIVYLGSQMLLRVFFPQQAGQRSSSVATMTMDNITVGRHPEVKLTNGTASGIVVASRCPQPPVDVLFVEEDGAKLTPLTSGETVEPCPPTREIPRADSSTISLAPWKYSIFSRTGTYEVRLPYTKVGAQDTGSGALQTLTARFTIAEPGTFTKLYRTFISKPLLNSLVFFASILPGHNLGVAIILLTILVKLILFFPTQHALEGQKKMQLLQPKVDALKRQYPKDPRKLQEETMKLWKEHGVNPFQTCLPTLVQFPVLIGLFYTISDASSLALSRHLIYPVYQNLSWHFGTQFLGLDLLVPNLFIMPPLLVILQFLQMKLTFAISDRKKAKQQVIDVVKKGEPKESSPMQMQQKMMLYFLPLMIGFFAIKFPSAVSIYWGVSTLFAIGQQIIVNREHIRP